MVVVVVVVVVVVLLLLLLLLLRCMCTRCVAGLTSSCLHCSRVLYMRCACTLLTCGLLTTHSPPPAPHRTFEHAALPLLACSLLA